MTHSFPSSSYLSPPGRRSPQESIETLSDLTGQVFRQHSYPDDHGGFADVYRAKWQSENVAVKVLRSRLDEETFDIRKRSKRIRRELRVWQRLNHRNILPLYGISYDFSRYPAMVCPWLDNGNLNKYLERHDRTLTPLARFELLDGICEGLRYLHASDVVHGDLTGSNVLINSQGKPCLCDFGLSKIMVEFEGTSYFTSTRGAIRWAARELYRLRNEDHDYISIINNECDIYSMGRVILQVLSGHVPYHYIKSDAQVLLQLNFGINPIRPAQSWITDPMWGFMQKCWRAPGLRPDIREVSAFIQHFRVLHSASDVQEFSPSDLGRSNAVRLKMKESTSPSSEGALIQDITPITSLFEAYKDPRAAPFLEQIEGLVDDGLGYIRQTIGDGDCLYRSVGFAFIERVLHSSTPRQDAAQAVSILNSTRSLLEIAGFQASVYEDPLSIMISILQQIVIPDLNGERLTSEILLEAFQSIEVSNSVVWYLRYLTSAQIRADPDSYTPFLIDFGMEPVEFCATFVEPLGVDANDIQLSALSRALGLNIHLARLQRRKLGSLGVDMTYFEHGRLGKNNQPISLLHRPGHFELLYPTH